jgi:hypothetical protein
MEMPWMCSGRCQTYRVRRIGMDTPEDSDPYFEGVTNKGSELVEGKAIALVGWMPNARDSGRNFDFPSYMLNPGQSCRLHTTENHPDTCGFSFGGGQAIWNNKGDCGYLYNSSNKVVFEYCY